uniref:SLC26A/SulP transporter domain-containing protein n=1 Tax=Mola mola TaxID=94237 RepID=A0A3Q3WVY3_MOLML
MHPDRPRYVIDRPVYNLPDLHREFDRRSRQFPVGERVKKLFRYNIKTSLHLPVLRWLPQYKVKENLLCDVISGVGAGTIQVPQGMAFALLASLPPVNGLYSSFFPLVPYFFMGTAHQMVPGTFAVLSSMVGGVCLSLAPGIGLGFMQFGFVAIYLSESSIRGFMSTAGLQILILVVKYIFGIHVPPYSGPLAAVYFGISLMTQRFLNSFAMANIFYRFVANMQYKVDTFPIPVVHKVVAATAISGLLHLPDVYHMAIVGEIPLGFPAPVVPTVSQWEDMFGPAFSLAIVGYVISLAVGRTLAAKRGYDVDPNQEMLALGCSHFLRSFFRIHVISCALSVTLAVDSAGGTTQASDVKHGVWVVSFLATFFLSLPYGVAIGVRSSVLVVIFRTQL